MAVDPYRLAFLRGVLAALASNGQVVHYEEVRRLCRLNKEQMGEYLGEARARLVEAGQPDFCAVVVREDGLPGAGWQQALDHVDPATWSRGLAAAHRFWRDRRLQDNGEITQNHGQLPVEPGL